MGDYAFNMGVGRAPLTLDPMGELQQAQAQAKQSQLVKLLGAAANGQGDYTQANMIDPIATQGFQKNQAGLQDDRMSSFAKRAAMASAAWKAGNQQLAQGIYQTLVPDAHAIAPGFNLPPQMDDSAAAAFDHIANKAQEPYTLSPGSKRFGENNQVVAEVPFAPQMVGVPNALGGQDYNLIDKGTGQARPVMMGGQQAPTGPRDATEAPIYAQANMMTKAGMPPDKVEAWLNQQLGATPTIVDAAAPQAAPPQQLRSAPKPAAPPPTPSGYRYKADGSALEPIPGGPADTGGDYQLSRDAISNSAWDFILTGTKPQFARSHEGDKQRIAIQNEVANIAKQAGVSASELVTQKGKYKALQSSLSNLQKQSDTMDKANETFHRNADLMLSLSGKVPRFDSAAINKYVLDYRLNWSGDPATAAYIAAARTAVNEYAKIASGASGASGSTDTSRREAEQAISSAQNPQQLAAVIQTLKQDAANQSAATHDQLISIGGRMQQFGAPPASKPAGRVLKFNPATGKIE